jgi:hypothetical protein
MPGFMPDIHGFFGFAPPMTEESAAFQLSFGEGRQRRTRNPDAGTELVSGFRVRSLRPRPGMTAMQAYSKAQSHGRARLGRQCRARLNGDARQKAGHDK